MRNGAGIGQLSFNGQEHETKKIFNNVEKEKRCNNKNYEINEPFQRFLFLTHSNY